jgi:hypothetical protein
MQCLMNVHTCIDYSITMCWYSWKTCYCRWEEIWSLPIGPIQVHSVSEFTSNLSK